MFTKYTSYNCNNELTIIFSLLNFFEHLFFGLVQALIFILFFIEYTGVRSPLNYCNNNESPPKHLLIVQQDGTFRTQPYQQNNQPPTPSYAVQQTSPTYFNFFESTPSSSGLEESNRLSIDLNELPPDEYEEIQFL